MSRRGLVTGAVSAGVGALGLLAYAVGVEPYAVETVHVEVRIPRLPPAFDGYTIYQISDLHMRQIGRRERRVRRILDRLPPADLVAVTGDLVHTQAGIPPFLELAKSFRARDGVFAVFGNSEHKNGVRPYRFSKTLAACGVTPLMNAHVLFSRGESTLALAGVDDPVSSKDRLAAALDGVMDDVCTLLLMHSPDGIAEAAFRGVDLVLSGHTHGGQVALPFVGPVYTHSLLGRRMSHGYYAGKKLRRIIGIRPGRTQLYVTRGLGVSGLALRFLTRPELTVITLRPGTPRSRRVECRP